MCIDITFSLSVHCWWTFRLFQFLLIVNKAAANKGNRYLFNILFPFPSDRYPEVVLLNYMAILCLISWGPSILFPGAAAPTYMPTNRAQRFPFLHILGNILSLVFPNAYEVIVLVFWLHFLDISHMNICVYLLTICLSSLEKCLLRYFTHF